MLFYIGGAHRIPYISIGGTFPTQMVCILFSNLGASVTEVASDALVVEFSKTRKGSRTQSFTYAYLAVGALLGNLFGGFFLLKFAKPKFMFFIFAFLLTIQLALSITTKETSLHPAHDSIRLPARKSLKESLGEQFAHLVTAIRQTRILHPLLWIIASNMVVPLLSGSIFCFQTQCLVLDPFVIGLSKVVGQLIVLLNTALYNRYLKAIPMRRLIFGVQLFYALSFLSDLILVKQLNVAMGIPNDVYVLCISSLSEAIAQFKTLPFTILFSRLCPSGCEGSLFAFLASALCLSSILSGVLGVGLASYLGVSPENYSSLPVGIVIQILAALLPLGWISYVPSVRNLEIKMG
ncbi:hypothetical protein HPP92_008469 [Vanilla planifolia]|uniref:Uncharacterized protein n=1 Tax=Vanilla planifolia TaxID=51239 RepID=A0A835V5F0_VANPL|nr:hypothetical protein HPP92_008469 [Vanilla planifolia]